MGERRLLYFGCMRGAYGHTQAGHHFYGPGGCDAFWHDRELRVTTEAIVPWCNPAEHMHVDARLAPRPRGPHSEAPQGEAALHHKDGWTALSFWDQTGDSRGNSNSTFLVNEEVTFDDLLAMAQEAWPELFDRFDFEVVPHGVTALLTPTKQGRQDAG